MQCEMCGKESPLVRANIEGVTLSVCKKCGDMGKVFTPPTARAAPVRAVRNEPQLDIVADFSTRIRTAREKLGLSQQEFALKLNERESMLRNLESGSLRPSIELARKLERLLHIALVEEETAMSGAGGTHAGAGMTIGDLLKKR